MISAAEACKINGQLKQLFGIFLIVRNSCFHWSMEKGMKVDTSYWRKRHTKILLQPQRSSKTFLPTEYQASQSYHNVLDKVIKYRSWTESKKIFHLVFFTPGGDKLFWILSSVKTILQNAKYLQVVYLKPISPCNAILKPSVKSAVVKTQISVNSEVTLFFILHYKASIWTGKKGQNTQEKFKQVFA